MYDIKENTEVSMLADVLTEREVRVTRVSVDGVPTNAIGEHRGSFGRKFQSKDQCLCLLKACGFTPGKALSHGRAICVIHGSYMYACMSDGT